MEPVTPIVLGLMALAALGIAFDWYLVDDETQPTSVTESAPAPVAVEPAPVPEPAHTNVIPLRQSDDLALAA